MTQRHAHDPRLHAAEDRDCPGTNHAHQVGDLRGHADV